MADDDLEQDLLARLKTLSERLWEGRACRPEIDAWLGNFTGETTSEQVERLHALHLLANLNYYGLRELRVLLRTVYRDLYRYPLVQGIRESMGNTTDMSAVEAAFKAELDATRFIGMGNPAESGTHLLYYFRQENELPKDLFVSQHQLFNGPVSDQGTDFKEANLKHLVFLDDLLGSGQQSIEYSRTLLSDIERVAGNRGREVTTSYFVLFARTAGLEIARGSKFDEVAAVHEMDDTYLTFGPESRVYRREPSGIARTTAEAICRNYGTRLWPSHPLGYRDGQLLLGFHHNIPDNTLPIIWWNEPVDGWEPILSRYPKVG